MIPSSWLVVFLEHDWMIFPETVVNGIIIPIDELIFFRAGETTKQLVICYITMENHHFLVGISTISMAIFHRYVQLPEGSDMESILRYSICCMNGRHNETVIACPKILRMESAVNGRSNQ